MENQPPNPFAIITPRLIILPTPSAISIPAYRLMYAHLHSLPSFCTMAFGHHYLPRETSDPDMITHLQGKIASTWTSTGLGDCAVGLLSSPLSLGKALSPTTALLSGGDFTTAFGDDGSFWDSVTWVGYVGLRDCSPNLPPRLPDDLPLPPWQEMVELRYGFAPEAWGKGFGTECAKALMLWGEKEMGVRRYVAETERANVGSGGILGKLGFVKREGIEYWKEESEFEWEMFVKK